MDDIILEIEEYAKLEDVPIMQKRGINFLCDLIKDNKIKNILEIGSAIGYSSIKMALVDKDIKVTTIERDENRYLEAVKNIKRCNLENQIDIILGDALETEIKGTYDLIFIDAAKAQYIKFFNKYKENLASNGIILSDNMSFHGLVEEKERIKNKNLRQLVNKIKRYIVFLEENTEFKTDFYKVGDGIAVSRRVED
ncbi:MAG: O-methyltransferase [Bacilli bacterium]|nr:O-methyltransferase [Bacilli bacterium]